MRGKVRIPNKPLAQAIAHPNAPFQRPRKPIEPMVTHQVFVEYKIATALEEITQLEQIKINVPRNCLFLPAKDLTVNAAVAAVEPRAPLGQDAKLWRKSRRRLGLSREYCASRVLCCLSCCDRGRCVAEKSCLSDSSVVIRHLAIKLF